MVLAFGLVTVLTTGSSQRVSDIDDRPVVIASLPCDSAIQATSSGFVIDDSTVVTVAHALYDSREFAVRDAFGRWHQATIQYIDLDRDLAVLKIRGLRADAMKTSSARAGDQVRMMEGAASGTTTGEVLRPVRITTEVIGDMSQQSQRAGYELTVPIIGGDSGAAVVDQEDNLVALVFARSKRRDASWATSASEINLILEFEGGPTWECDRDSEAVLLLAPAEKPTLVN